MGFDKTWSHPYLWLSIPRNEKNEARTDGIWRKRSPFLARNHGRHEGSLGGKRRISVRAGVNSRRSQGRARMTTSRSPSWQRAPSGSPYGRDWGLPNNYGGACTSQWGVAQDQRGIENELASIGSTSRLGTFPKFVIKGWPQVVLSTNHGRACATELHNTQYHLFL